MFNGKYADIVPIEFLWAKISTISALISIISCSYKKTVGGMNTE